MNNAKTLQDFKRVLTLWQEELPRYSPEQLQARPDERSWSMGQLYNHLIDSAINFHLKEVDRCLSSLENRTGRKNLKGFVIYNILNGFPPVKIAVPPSDSYTPKQPEGMEELRDGLEKVARAMEETLPRLRQEKTGKTAHPALAFLNAAEWYKLVEMHYRHHLRQKEALELFLKDEQEKSR